MYSFISLRKRFVWLVSLSLIISHNFNLRLRPLIWEFSVFQICFLFNSWQQRLPLLNRDLSSEEWPDCSDKASTVQQLLRQPRPRILPDLRPHFFQGRIRQPQAEDSSPLISWLLLWQPLHLCSQQALNSCRKGPLLLHNLPLAAWTTVFRGCARWESWIRVWPGGLWLSWTAICKRPSTSSFPVGSERMTRQINIFRSRKKEAKFWRC